MKILHKDKVTAACGCQACVNANDPLIHSVHKDRVVYFCTDKCKEKFDADPDEFLKSSHFKIPYADLDQLRVVEQDSPS